MNEPSRNETAIEFLTQATTVTFPGHVGIEIVEIGDGSARMRCEIQPHHLAPNGFLHAGAVVTLADTAAGYACFVNRPETSTGFTTIELKSNFTGTLREGAMVANATMIHGGQSTQVWDVEVTDEGSDKKLAYFRATQMILYPRG